MSCSRRQSCSWCSSRRSPPGRSPRPTTTACPSRPTLPTRSSRTRASSTSRSPSRPRTRSRTSSARPRAARSRRAISSSRRPSRSRPRRPRSRRRPATRRSGRGSRRTTASRRSGSTSRATSTSARPSRFTFDFDLPGGLPRSDSDIRVGSAFATFYAWAFGDGGDVRVVVPRRLRGRGERIADRGVRRGRRHDGRCHGHRRRRRVVFGHRRRPSGRADPATPRPAGRRAPRHPGLARGRGVAEPGPRPARGRAADPDRQDRARLAGRGRPPCREVHTPLLEGYAGFFYTDEDRIEISEDLDELTIIHEASHAWFNDRPLRRPLDRRGASPTNTRRGSSTRSRTAGWARSRSPPDARRHRLERLGATRPDRRRGDEQSRALCLRRLVGARPRAHERDRRGRDAQGPRRRPRQSHHVRRCRRAGDHRLRERLAPLPRPARGRRRFDPRGRDVPPVGRQRGRQGAARGAGLGPPGVLQPGRGRGRLAAGLRGPRSAGSLAVRAGRTWRSRTRWRCSRHARSSSSSPRTPGSRCRPRCARRTKASTAPTTRSSSSLPISSCWSRRSTRRPTPSPRTTQRSTSIGLIGSDPSAGIERGEGGVRSGRSRRSAGRDRRGRSGDRRRGRCGPDAGPGGRRRDPDRGRRRWAGGRRAAPAAGRGDRWLRLAPRASRPWRWRRLPHRRSLPRLAARARQATRNRTLHSPPRDRPNPSPRSRRTWTAKEETERESSSLMGMVRTRPSREILSGDSADVYFARAASILEREGLDPLVTMEVFTREDAILCGIDEAKNLLGHVLARCDPAEVAGRGARRRRHDRPQGGRPPDPGPLPAVRAVRDRPPRDARPVDRLGDRGQAMRRGRQRRRR